MKKVIVAFVAVCVTAAGFLIGSSAQASVDTKAPDCRAENKICFLCNGSGWVGDKMCGQCGGTGRSIGD